MKGDFKIESKVQETFNCKCHSWRNDAVSDVGGVVHAAADVQPSNPSSGNTVELNDEDYTINGETTSHDGTFTEFDAGYNIDGDASNNTLTVNGARVTTFLNGGYSPYTGNTNYNFLTINGGTFDDWVEGGWAVTGNANYNRMIINGGNFTGGIIDGGYTVNGDTNYNTVTINGGTINAEVYGGFVAGSGNAIGNEINIYGGEFNSYIYGGYISNTGSVENNNINVYGNPDLTDSTLIAARSATSSSGNNVNIYTSDITARNIGGFENLNFYLPSTATNGTNILTLTDSNGTDLSNTVLNVYADGAANFNSGDTINLVINNNGGLTTSDLTNSGVLTKGVSIDYDLTLNEVTDDSGKITAMSATLGGVTGNGLKEQTRLISNAPVSNIQLATISSEKLLEWLPPVDFEVLEEDHEETSASEDADLVPEIIEPKGFEVFMNAGVGRMKTKTGNDTLVESTGGNYDLGAARTLEQGHGNLNIAPIVQYGHGHYDTYSNGTHGQGSTKNIMGGLIFRKMNNSGFYYESSFRAGRTENDFSSRDLLSNGANTLVEYHASMPVFAGHVKLGNATRIDRNNLLDVYGIYFFTRQNGTDVTLSTGEQYNFSSSNNHRIKLGYRLTTRTSHISRIYTGLAYQYEKSSDSVATYAGYSTPATSNKGSSGMIEIGWLIKPNKKIPLMVDINVTDWFGHEQGLTATAKIKKAF